MVDSFVRFFDAPIANSDGGYSADRHTSLSLMTAGRSDAECALVITVLILCSQVGAKERYA